MTESPVKYEEKGVTAVRGMESRTIAKWEKEGWELLSQEQRNALQVHLSFRQPERKLPPYSTECGAVGGTASEQRASLGHTADGASMPRRFLVERVGERFDLVESPAPSEHHLQEVMKMNLQLIPTDDLGLDGDLLVIGRETSLASGSIDPLCLASSVDDLDPGSENVVIANSAGLRFCGL